MEGKKIKSVISIVGLALGLAVLFFVAKNIRDTEKIILEAGVAGPLVAIGLYALLAATPIPTDPLTLVCGAVYGPYYGTAIAWMGYNAAALVEYYVGKRISQKADFENEVRKLPFGLGKLPINSIPVLIFGRMLPFYGAKVISIMAGMYRVPYKRYIWTSAVINFVGAAMFSYGGFRIIDYIKNIF